VEAELNPQYNFKTTFVVVRSSKELERALKHRRLSLSVLEVHAGV
jgi:hypothetical protein